MRHIIHYVFPMMLGTTFNLNNMKVGVDIFSKEEYDKKEIYFLPETSQHYGLVKNTDEARNLLSANYIFSLKVKAGVLNAGASGEYLFDHMNRRNTVDMVMKTTHLSILKYFRDKVKPIPTWKKYGEALGKHYVCGIIYGGEIITSLRFETNSTKVKDRIEPTISNRIFNFGSQDLDEDLQNILSSVLSTQIRIYASIPFSSLPNDVDSYKNSAFKQLKHTVEQSDNEKGLPLKLSFASLKDFDSTLDDLNLRNREVEYKLEQFEFMFDDLLQTKMAMSNWLKRMIKPITEKQEEEVGDLYNSIENTLKVFHEVIGSLDISQGAEQLKKAVDLYASYSPDKDYIEYGYLFYRKYRNLRKTLE